MPDSALSGLPALTLPELLDILGITDDPGGTPISKKITLADLFRNANYVVPVTIGAWVQTDFGLTAGTGVQSAFPTASDVITLTGSKTYRFQGKYILTGGTTSHTVAMTFLAGGGLTVHNIEYTTIAFAANINAIGTAQSTKRNSTLAANVVSPAITTTECVILFDGIVRVNVGGTLTPQITFSANPTGTNLMKIGSYIEFWEIGAHDVVEVGSWG